jgi:hypothetical protein
MQKKKVVCMRRYYVGEENQGRYPEAFLLFNTPEKETQALRTPSLCVYVPLALA